MSWLNKAFGAPKKGGGGGGGGVPGAQDTKAVDGLAVRFLESYHHQPRLLCPLALRRWLVHPTVPKYVR